MYSYLKEEMGNTFHYSKYTSEADILGMIPLGSLKNAIQHCITAITTTLMLVQTCNVTLYCNVTTNKCGWVDHTVAVQHQSVPANVGILLRHQGNVTHQSYK